MMESEQIKPITEIDSDESEIISIIEEKKEVKEKEQQKITALPSWSIEPPIEISRGA